MKLLNKIKQLFSAKFKGDVEADEAITLLNVSNCQIAPLATAQISGEPRKIVFAGSDRVDEHENLAREFLKKIFDLDYDSCLVSDESCLSDFSGCCVPHNYNRRMLWPEINALGKEITITKIRDIYGLDVDPSNYLVDVLDEIKEKNNE